MYLPIFSRRAAQSMHVISLLEEIEWAVTSGLRRNRHLKDGAAAACDAGGTASGRRRHRFVPAVHINCRQGLGHRCFDGSRYRRPHNSWLAWDVRDPWTFLAKAGLLPLTQACGERRAGLLAMGYLNDLDQAAAGPLSLSRLAAFCPVSMHLVTASPL